MRRGQILFRLSNYIEEYVRRRELQLRTRKLLAFEGARLSAFSEPAAVTAPTELSRSGCGASSLVEKSSPLCNVTWDSPDPSGSGGIPYSTCATMGSNNSCSQ